MIDDADPRLAAEYVRTLTAGDEYDDVVLIGAVHDHPASRYRAKVVIEAVEPDLLALELPPVAIPLFEQYGEDPRTPPTFGGEMSTAIQAAGTHEVVGIDGPTVDFLLRLVRTVYREGESIGTLLSALRSVKAITGRAIRCRLAAAVARRTGIRLEVDDPVDHECRYGDDPATQATDEREQVRRARAVATVFGRPDAVRVRETVREAHMADRLTSLRRDGVVAAVVGIDHLDPLCERLKDEEPSDGE